MRLNIKNLILLSAVLFFSTLGTAQTHPLHATIDVSKPEAPISKYIYGQFLEHIGGIVNSNVWAEMLEDRTAAVLNPVGLLFKLYREHFGTIPVDVTGDSPQPKPLYPAGGDQPSVNPGSATYPLDVSAALSEDRKTLTIAVLNPSDSAQQLKLTINGVALASRGRLWRMAPSSIDATITVGQKPGVEVQQQELTSLPDAMTVPPFSVNSYSFVVE